jgi:hypothetical protein
MTPGPWRVEIISGDMAQVLAKSYCVADDVRPSDARLIAAAPDLLQALQQLINLHGASYTDLVTDDEAWAKARAAIAKAEGRS